MQKTRTSINKKFRFFCVFVPLPIQPPEMPGYYNENGFVIGVMAPIQPPVLYHGRLGNARAKSPRKAPVRRKGKQLYKFRKTRESCKILTLFDTRF